MGVTVDQGDIDADWLESLADGRNSQIVVMLHPERAMSSQVVIERVGE
jgi:hypothetical protein